MELKVVDNYQCARALDRFHQGVVKPLQERIQKNEEHIKTLSKENSAKMQPSLDALKIQMDKLEEFEVTVMVLIQRHEKLVNVLAKHFYAMREKVVFEGKVPPDLFEEQVEILTELYKFMMNSMSVLDL